MASVKNDIIVELHLEASRQLLWAVITEHRHMVQWFFPNIPEFKAEEGFITSFDVKAGERTFHHQWKILEVKPEEKILYHWSYGGYDGKSTVCFELLDHIGKTTLRLTHSGLHTFPMDVPEFSRQSCRSGWEYFLGERLKKYIEVPAE